LQLQCQAATHRPEGLLLLLSYLPAEEKWTSVENNESFIRPTLLRLIVTIQSKQRQSHIPTKTLHMPHQSKRKGETTQTLSLPPAD
jgi:hypothetical protein